MTKKEEALFQQRLSRHLDEVGWLYMALYNNDSMFAELCEMLQAKSRIQAEDVDLSDVKYDVDV